MRQNHEQSPSAAPESKKPSRSAAALALATALFASSVNNEVLAQAPMAAPAGAPVAAKGDPYQEALGDTGRFISDPDTTTAANESIDDSLAAAQKRVKAFVEFAQKAPLNLTKEQAEALYEDSDVINGFVAHELMDDLLASWNSDAKSLIASSLKTHNRYPLPLKIQPKRPAVVPSTPGALVPSAAPVTPMATTPAIVAEKPSLVEYADEFKRLQATSERGVAALIWKKIYCDPNFIEFFTQVVQNNPSIEAIYGLKNFDKALQAAFQCELERRLGVVGALNPKIARPANVYNVRRGEILKMYGNADFQDGKITLGGGIDDIDADALVTKVLEAAKKDTKKPGKST